MKIYNFFLIVLLLLSHSALAQSERERMLQNNISNAVKTRNSDQIARAYEQMGDYKAAQGAYAVGIDNMIYALSNYEKANDKRGRETVIFKISDVYAKSGKLKNAIDYSEKALKLAKQIDDIEGQRRAYRQLSDYWKRLGDQKKSDFYAELYKKTFKSATEVSQKENEIARLRREQDELRNQIVDNAEKDAKLKDLEAQINATEGELSKKKEAFQRMEDSLSMAVVEQQSKLELAKEKEKRTQTTIAGGVALLIVLIILAVVIFVALRRSRQNAKMLARQNIEIENQKALIEIEKEKSDALLLNILPKATAEELKEKGFATPQSYEKVTILFTDFKGFTGIAEHLSAEDIIKELNYCFLEFDKICDKHNVEKIKTIGDAYMAAGGVPIPNTSNPIDVVQAGLEMQRFMLRWRREREEQGYTDFFELRLGIHTGSIVAGVVGKNKFAYDIWGDAVNLAARMESSGEVGRVNISGQTYELIKDNFECTYRGRVTAKNKGEVDMYFVDMEK